MTTIAQMTVSTQTLQRALAYHYDLEGSCGSGGCDGIYGPETKDATTRYLGDNLQATMAVPTHSAASDGRSVVFKGEKAVLDRLRAFLQEDVRRSQVPARSSAASPPAPVPAPVSSGSSFSMPTWGWALIGVGVVGGGILAYRQWGKR